MGWIFESTIMEILYLTLLTFWLLYLYFVKDYGYWESKQVIHVPAVFPFGSMVKAIMGTSCWGVALDKIYKEFKNERYVGFTYIRKPMLLIRDPELVRLILQKDFLYFTDRLNVDTHPKDYMTYHLFSMKGQNWKNMRLKLTPAYTAAKVKSMFFLVKRSSDNLLKVIDQSLDTNSGVDVKDVLSRYTVDVIATCAFGLEIDSLLNKNLEFYEAGVEGFKVDFSVLFKMYICGAFPIFSKVHCFDFMNSKIKNFITGVIRSTVEYREKNEIIRLDFLDLLIKLMRNQNILEEGEKPADFPENSGKKEGLTIEQITAETYLFFMAGYETTSNTIMFCLYELACSGRIQDRLYWEVEEVLDRHEGDISYQALEEMTYMDQVINETLRRYPVFTQLSRDCTQPYRFPGSKLEIDKDVGVVIPVYSLHHDPKYFPDPYTFNPERFSPENCKNRHHYVYLPFGEGPRICIGLRFGLMKVKTALATLISSYQISLTPDTDVPLELKSNAFITLPSKPLMLDFTRRNTTL